MEGKLITQTCVSCGTPFGTFPCHIQSGSAKGNKCEKCRGRKKRVSVLCAQCGTPLTIKQSVYDANSNKRFYCNSKCMGLWRTANFVGERHPAFKPKILVNCAVCRAEKFVHESQFLAYERFLCGDQCRGELCRKLLTGTTRSEFVDLRCDYCGKVRRDHVSQSNMYARHFCDLKCRGAWTHENLRGEVNPNWRGGGRTDPIMRRINSRMPAGIRSSLRLGKQGRSWESLTGYTVWELRAHLESTMPVGYTWANFLTGGLHIDHKTPSAAFCFKSTDDPAFKECWKLSNLQLLPAEENMRKGGKMVWPPVSRLVSNPGPL